LNYFALAPKPLDVGNEDRMKPDQKTVGARVDKAVATEFERNVESVGSDGSKVLRDFVIQVNAIFATNARPAWPLRVVTGSSNHKADDIRNELRDLRRHIDARIDEAMRVIAGLKHAAKTTEGGQAAKLQEYLSGKEQRADKDPETEPQTLQRSKKKH
jgi:hypothetical protein